MGFDKLTKTNTVTKLLQVQSGQSSIYSCQGLTLHVHFCRGPVPSTVLLVHSGRPMKDSSHVTQLHVYCMPPHTYICIYITYIYMYIVVTPCISMYFRMVVPFACWVHNAAPVLCCAVVCCAVLCCAVLCCAVLCWNVRLLCVLCWALPMQQSRLEVAGQVVSLDTSCFCRTWTQALWRHTYSSCRIAFPEGTRMMLLPKTSRYRLIRSAL